MSTDSSNRFRLPRELVEVGYFLSRFGNENPPEELKASSWKESYLKFFSAFGTGKTDPEFRNSLNNIRDQYDGRFKNGRVGWRGKDGAPVRMSELKEEVYSRFESLSRQEIWKIIRPYATISYSSKNAKIFESVNIQSGEVFFNSEFQGRMKSKEISEKEMNVTHGAVIDSLYGFIKAEIPSGEVYNTQKIDLAVNINGMLAEIYELKTSTDSQSIYTAIGQLFMHSAGSNKVEKWIVLPGRIDNMKLLSNLDTLGVQLIQYYETEAGYLFEKVK